MTERPVDLDPRAVWPSKAPYRRVSTVVPVPEVEVPVVVEGPVVLAPPAPDTTDLAPVPQAGPRGGPR